MDGPEPLTPRRAEALLDTPNGGWQWPAVRELERAGGLEPSYSDAWVAAMVMAFAYWGDRGALRELEADPELLEHAVWRLFEVDGGEVGSLARADKYTRPEHGWSHALLTLAADGRLDRERLLDATLAALERDFPAFRAQWFTAFHEGLAPTAQERLARAGAYLRLLASPVEGTLTFALRAVTPIAGRLDPAALEAALPGPLASERKGTVRAALRLLERHCDGAGAATIAAGALQHPAADVQEAALAAVERLAGEQPPEAVRAALAGYAEVVAATVRERFERLAGVAAAAEPAPVAAGPPRVDRGPLEPPAGAAALAELLTRVLEQPIPDPDDFDLALDGVARLCGSREPLAGPLAPLVPRARRLAETVRPAAAVLVAWADGAVDDRLWADPAHGDADLAGGRALEVARHAAAGVPVRLHATPTHRGSWIDPRELQRRVGVSPGGAGPLDVVQASYRLPAGHGPVPPRVSAGRRYPGAPVEIDVPLPREPFADLGDIPAAWGRLLGRAWLEFGGPAAVRQVRSTWPAFSDGLYALGASVLQWPAADSVSGASAFLAALHETDGDLGEPGVALLLVALGSGQDATGLLAAEATAALLAGGRLPEDAVADTLSEWIAGGALPARRVARRLAVVAETGPAAAASVQRWLEAAVPGAGREAHHVLELLDELAARNRTPVASGGAREWLAAQRGATKTARLARSLLARK